jgi:hypothetical protein
VVALLATLAAASAAAPAPASAAAAPDMTIFDVSHEAIGYRGVAARLAAFQDMSALGVDTVRLLVWWQDVAPGRKKKQMPAGFQPKNSNTYGPDGSGWAGVDAAVRLAAARGISVYLVPSGGPVRAAIPRWASLTPKRGAHNPDPAAYRDFMQAIGSRYNGDFDPDGIGPDSTLPAVSMIGVWNEPANSTYLLPQRRGHKLVSPKRYRKLFNAARSGLDAAGWNGKLLIGETGPQGVGSNPDPLSFMRGVLCLNKKYKRKRKCPRLEADGWAHHPYALSFAPWQKPPGADRVSIGSMGRLNRALRRAGRAKALPRGLPIYITEFGYQSKPDRSFGLPLRRHAEYLAISEWIAHKDPRVVSYGQYLLHDDPKHYGPGGFQSGLRFADDKPKPAFAGFRLPLAARIKRKDRVTLWGRVRPATGATTVRIRFRDRGRAAKKLKNVKTDSSGYFTLKAKYKRGRLFGVEWEGSAGPLIRAYRW